METDFPNIDDAVNGDDEIYDDDDCLKPKRLSWKTECDHVVKFINVTVPQQAEGPDFPPVYVSTSFRYIILCGLNGSKTFMTTQCTISNHFL